MLIDEFRSTQKKMNDPSSPVIGQFYDNLVDKLFERIEEGFVDLVQ